MSAYTPISRAKRARGPGFTLIEAMITIVLLSILMLLAAPSYEQFLRRAHRSEAIGLLLRAAACQERVRAAHGAYDTALCLPARSARYAFRYASDPPPSGRYFAVVAEPLGAQSRDTCGPLTYDAMGRTGALGEESDPARCWAGR